VPLRTTKEPSGACNLNSKATNDTADTAVMVTRPSASLSDAERATSKPAGRPTTVGLGGGGGAGSDGGVELEGGGGVGGASPPSQSVDTRRGLPSTSTEPEETLASATQAPATPPEADT